jgi:two-component system cell cycle sensor histidine kinase PleC
VIHIRNANVFWALGVLVTLTLIIGSACALRTITARSLVIAPLHQTRVALAQFYILNEWLPHASDITPALKEPPNTWANNQVIRDFLTSTLNYTAKLPVIKFSLYTAERIKFFSTTDSVVNTNISSWKGVFSLYSPFEAQTSQDMLFDIASKGRTKSKVVDNALYAGTNRQQVTGPVLQTMVPIFDNAKDPKSSVIGYIELFTDIKDSWQFLDYLTYGFILVILLVSFAVIIFIIRRDQMTEIIIAKQFETNAELEAAKARAEIENEEKSKFLANISHELRTPLNAIIGFSEIIESEAHGPLGSVKYKDYISDIHHSGTHLLSLINDILDLSKAEAQKLQVDATPINICKIARSSVRIIQSRADDAHISLISSIPREDIVIIGDHKRFKQVLLNLLSNAVKFTPGDGKVTLSIMPDEATKTVKISVIDTGIGIAAKDIAVAMAAFGQVDSEHSRKFQGTGLGLPLTKHLVELMKGSFNIMSELGLGTTVSAIFALDNIIPAAAEEGAHHAHATAELPPMEATTAAAPEPQPLSPPLSPYEPAEVVAAIESPAPPLSPYAAAPVPAIPSEPPLSPYAAVPKPAPAAPVEPPLSPYAAVPEPAPAAPVEPPLSPYAPAPEFTPAPAAQVEATSPSEPLQGIITTPTSPLAALSAVETTSTSEPTSEQTTPQAASITTSRPPSSIN